MRTLGVDPSKMTDDGNDGNMQKMMDEIWAKGIEELASGEQFDPDAPIFHMALRDTTDEEVDEEEESIPLGNIISSNNEPCIKSIPSESILPGIGSVPIRTDGVIVLIRHGKTEHNKVCHSEIVLLTIIWFSFANIGTNIFDITYHFSSVYSLVGRYVFSIIILCSRRSSRKINSIGIPFV